MKITSAKLSPSGTAPIDTGFAARSSTDGRKVSCGGHPGHKRVSCKFGGSAVRKATPTHIRPFVSRNDSYSSVSRRITIAKRAYDGTVNERHGLCDAWRCIKEGGHVSCSNPVSRGDLDSRFGSRPAAVHNGRSASRQ